MTNVCSLLYKHYVVNSFYFFHWITEKDTINEDTDCGAEKKQDEKEEFSHFWFALVELDSE